ncbi:DoxX family protein [Streptomyces sp. SID5785]|uniref:DoxX family protein n=1 Tax=Streptomyces sp. SID5785 TaxID=2690309 RepID=UPI001360D946|nr:DoxX family protein [Streptomyces sp. SID5785]MZD04356.1 DoxX family protein [Streptomyces sp. SID5785]
MYAFYAAVTMLGAAVFGAAAVANLSGHSYPRAQADRLEVPRSWIPLLGAALGAGALGLLAGFAVPGVGAAAATGLVLYFVGALATHVLAGDRALGFWAFCFALAVASLVLRLIV